MTKRFLSALSLTVALSLAAGAPLALAGDEHLSQAELEERAKNAEPGTYWDWCPEHQVPESLDTRCNAALIPAFKLTGDWCKKHGLPLSQDTKCDPDLKIVRPSKPAGEGS
ncbi:MAG TPA: hypothetical protein VK997_02535 [Deferrisomatales bacterium]|nr:hypothetical protein [Deferrisomatales bacterium]